MSGKSTIDVLNKVKKTALDEEIARYVAYHRYYQRLIAIRIISEGHTIAEAARIIGKSLTSNSNSHKLALPSL